MLHKHLPRSLTDPSQWAAFVSWLPSCLPAHLPVVQARADIIAALKSTQVLILTSETGSGKSTQLAKLCWMAGLGASGRIGHTQPRRVAALGVAEQIKKEVGPKYAHWVGTQVRFDRRLGKEAKLKVMTEGILLAELQNDPNLKAYDVIILDEAHERSLNLDFLMGYLQGILKKRPEFRLIITSATLSLEAFKRYFKPARLVQVEGKQYPIALRYRPRFMSDMETPLALEAAILESIVELDQVKRGHILVFLPGEQAILSTQAHLKANLSGDNLLYPLYARLPLAQQARACEPSQKRKIILATNVAETSLTIPAIDAVIDSGLVRVMRYLPRTRLASLREEMISQSAAEQRKGRCGRTGPGICIRLYAEADLLLRPLFPDPEIARISLAALIIKMLQLGLNDITGFPFIDPPELRRVNEGLSSLQLIDAVRVSKTRSARPQLTALGRKIAQLSIEPTLARCALFAACAHQLASVLPVIAGMSIDGLLQGLTSEMKTTCKVQNSDFLLYLQLWDYLNQFKATHSATQYKKGLQQMGLAWTRVKEWEALVALLQQQIGRLGYPIAPHPLNEAAFHQALLSGLILGVASWDPVVKRYRGVSGGCFTLHRASCLAKKTPQWILMGERIELSGKLWASQAAKVEPEWIAQVAKGYLKQTVLELAWDPTYEKVFAWVQVTCLGLTLSSRKKSGYYPETAQSDAQACFIQAALIDQAWKRQYGFLKHNRSILEAFGSMDTRLRQFSAEWDEAKLKKWYIDRIPLTIASAQSFDEWLKQGNEARLTLPPMAEQLQAATALAYPDSIAWQDERFPLTYLFEPQNPEDGVSVHLPLLSALRLPKYFLAAHLPSYRTALILDLIRGLPKADRARLTPAAHYAQALAERVSSLCPKSLANQPFSSVLSELVRQIAGVAIPATAWNEAALPPWLKVNYKIYDAKQVKILEGRCLASLQGKALVHQSALALLQAVEKSPPSKTWRFPTIQSVASDSSSGLTGASGFDTLQVTPEGVVYTVVLTKEQAIAHLIEAIRWLLVWEHQPYWQRLWKPIRAQAQWAVLQCPHLTDAEQIGRDLLYGLVHAVYAPSTQGIPCDNTSWNQLRVSLKALMVEQLALAKESLLAISDAYQALQKPLKHTAQSGRYPWAVASIQTLCRTLLRPGWLKEGHGFWFKHIARYLKACEIRLDRVGQRMRADQEKEAQWALLNHQWDQLPDPLATQEKATARWMMYEWYVSSFAQHLGTAISTSTKRLEQTFCQLSATHV